MSGQLKFGTLFKVQRKGTGGDDLDLTVSLQLLEECGF
jgi:hypothetical protein